MSYIKYKKKNCERCGISEEKSIQRDENGFLISRAKNAPWSLTVHHIDHNHQNDDPANLETLCRKCHDKEHNM